MRRGADRPDAIGFPPGSRQPWGSHYHIMERSRRRVDLPNGRDAIVADRPDRERPRDRPHRAGHDIAVDDERH